MKKIAVVMGGFSKESFLSLESGQIVFDNLCRKKYEPYKAYILDNKWVINIDNNIEYPINKEDFSIIRNHKRLNFDCIFNIIHGTPGEDGILSAYFELLKIPYTGCNFYQSNITFNKKYCLSFVKNFGIKIANSIFINKNQIFSKEKILKKIGTPCFVKPTKSGSSLGISKVNNKKEFDSALKTAFKKDDEVIIEEFLNGIEVSVGVYSFHDKITILPITEIISQNDFFDFESKYSGKSKEITPARLSNKIENKLLNIAEKIFRILNLTGMARSEFIIVDEEPFFLEINTIPGFSKESIFPKQLKVAGISLSDFFHKMISSSFN
ncbi:D-alanine--D-alanine ligase [Blattabacterium cuenoti]|uniref:D-alanine--D-alanine ligase n=1 Tax=Blattabacterium cuenoti TaxID=1653831 RepID=UPI00163CC050|nr:D-alanine--D-alanine ligase [Blattabacterium cuenoti]